MSRIEEARGQRERELVRVADAVVAEVAVLGEELREVEVVERRVEDRHLVLLAVRDVDVERARLERLHEVAAEECRCRARTRARRRGSRSARSRSGCWSGIAAVVLVEVVLRGSARPPRAVKNHAAPLRFKRDGRIEHEAVAGRRQRAPG